MSQWVRSMGMVVLAAATVVVGVLAGVPAATADSCAVDQLLVNPCRPWLGANAGGYPGIDKSIQAQILAHESRIGRQVDVAHTYHQPGENALNSIDLAFINRPDTLLLTGWKPATDWATADGTNATVNATIDQMGQSLKAVAPRRVLLTVFHEPQNDVSGGSVACGPGFDYVGNAGTPADYRNMWRNVRNRFDALGVDNVVWAITYMSSSTYDCMDKELYPGDDLVDWVLFDVYGSPNVTFDAAVSSFYSRLESWSDADHQFTSKPWGLAEWNIRNNYTSAQAVAFYDDAKAALDAGTYPRLKLWSVFDNANGSNTRVGYDVNGQPDAAKQEHYTAFAQDPAFVGGWGGDSTPPEVSVTSPGGGDTVQASVTVTGSATDDSAVTSVRLLVDGVDRGPASVAADGSVTAALDTTTLPNGDHQLALVARDSGGWTTTSVPVVITVANPDVTAPGLPANVTAEPVDDSVHLTWGAATDDTAVAAYEVERDGALLDDQVTGTSYVDTGLSELTTYSYRVRARDTSGNLGAWSQPVDVSMPDRTSPGMVTGLSGAAAGTAVQLSWTATSDNVGVAGYRVYRNGTRIASLGPVTSYEDTGLSPQTSYDYAVEAFDAAGNTGQRSEVETVQTAGDTAPPSIPTDVQGSTSSSRIVLTWAASTDDVAVTGYSVYRDGILLATTTTRAYTDASGVQGRAYDYTVDAFDAVGHHSAKSSAVRMTVPDTTAPSRPGRPVLTAGSKQITLRWTASSDNVGVAGYRVYRGSTLIATVAGNVLTYTDTGLSGGKRYSYHVVAVDAAGNVSTGSRTSSTTARR